MITPPALIEWLSDKVERHRWGAIREPRTVKHSWFRAMGARNMRAGLSASIRPSELFSLEVVAPDMEVSYAMGAKNGVISVLLSQDCAPVLACSITLFDFEVHDAESSYAAFYAVAREATQQLLGIVPNFEHNIVW